MYVMPQKKLFAWQEKCLDRWFNNGGHGVVRVATGAGKTVLALAAAYNLAARSPAVPLRIRIVVPKVFLARQWREDIFRELGIPRRDVGIYCGAVKEDPRRPFVIYVLNTARSCISRHILREISGGASIFLICDECHHFASRENSRVFDFLPLIPPERYFSLGLSATPDCPGFDDIIVPALGREIYRYGLNEASRDNITASYNICNVSVKFSPDEKDEYDYLTEKIIVIRSKLFKLMPSISSFKGTKYFTCLNKLSEEGGDIGVLARSLLLLYVKRKETVHMAAERILCVYELVCRLINDNRIIVFSERIEAADALYRRLDETYPGKICRYHSEMGVQAKQRALERYRVGQSPVIVCCRALDEGLNVPETDAGIIMSASNGDRQRVQRAGRILRRGAGGKEKNLYYVYIPGTTEPKNLLSGEGRGTNVRELSYDRDSNRFENPLYDESAARVRGWLIARGATGRQLALAEQQIKRGEVRADFLLPASLCRERLAEAEPELRDYWIIMLRIATELGCVR